MFTYVCACVCACVCFGIHQISSSGFLSLGAKNHGSCSSCAPTLGAHSSQAEGLWSLVCSPAVCIKPYSGESFLLPQIVGSRTAGILHICTHRAQQLSSGPPFVCDSGRLRTEGARYHDMYESGSLWEQVRVGDLEKNRSKAGKSV